MGCLGIVLELNGTVGAIPLAFVLPALCYVKLATETPIWSRQKLPAIFMAAVGIGVSVLSIVRMISKGVTDCAHGEEMSYCHASLNATNFWTHCISFQHLASQLMFFSKMQFPCSILRYLGVGSP